MILVVFFFQILVDILQSNGSKAAPNELGRIVIKLPLPPGNLSTLYKNDELFCKTYFQKFPVNINIFRLEWKIGDCQNDKISSFFVFNSGLL